MSHSLKININNNEVNNQCIIKNIASLYNFSVGSYTEFMEENFKVSCLWIVEDGIHKRIIYGKVKPKLITDYRRAGLLT